MSNITFVERYFNNALKLSPCQLERQILIFAYIDVMSWRNRVKFLHLRLRNLFK